MANPQPLTFISTKQYSIGQADRQVSTMTVRDELNNINRTLTECHRRFQEADLERNKLDSLYRTKIDKVKQWSQAKRAQVENERATVLKYYRIAKDSTDKDLITTGISGEKPDIYKLNEMIELVNTTSRNDHQAGKIVDLTSRYFVFLDHEMSKIQQAEQSKIQKIIAQKDSELSRINDAERAALSYCRSYLASEKVKGLSALFDKIETDYTIDSRYFVEWKRPSKKKKKMLIGYGEFRVNIPQTLCPALKQSLGKYFDEASKCVYYPCGFTTTSSEIIDIEYTETNERQVRGGLQALVLNFMRYFEVTKLKISVFDQIYYNAGILGSLTTLAEIKGSLIEKTPFNDSSLKDSIESLAAYYRKVESKIGARDVYEYNRVKKPEDQIPYRLIILNRDQDHFGTETTSELSFVLNNASKFGLTVIRLTKSSDGGSKGKDREKKRLKYAKDHLNLISGSSGDFYIADDTGWVPFRWIEAPSSFPPSFLSRVKHALKPIKRGTKYFDRYKLTLPVKTRTSKRKPIVLPFAVDDDDTVITCSFENETFAAYVMGAAGSGKSTLLHTLICGILMNYHPDEVELWLMDFKMLEFRKYLSSRPPHIKYLLLEKSEDLIFDIIDKLTEELERREYIFSQKGWQKLMDVPVNEYMPAIFVIVDEFAQMSQIIRESRGSGYGLDYTIKLENLLAKGRALGFKFIFASQTYTTGVSGLTETACKQIQLRFALKNSRDEIVSTLDLASEQLTSALSKDINSLPPYETLFKWRDKNGEICTGRFKNLYVENAEIDKLMAALSNHIKPCQAGKATNDRSYVEKNPVMIEGEKPKTFRSQIPLYKEYERSQDEGFLEDNDFLIYPGVPCSFKLAKPFMLSQGTSENILILGGDKDSTVNVSQSIIVSYARFNNPIEIWAHPRSAIIKKYKNTIFSKRMQFLELTDICARITELKQEIMHKQNSERMVLCFGLERIFDDLDILDETDFEEPCVISTLDDLMQKLNLVESEAEKDQIINEYNSQVDRYNSSQNATYFSNRIFDARDDYKWLVKKGSLFGLHFVCCFERAKDWLNLRISTDYFNHKILFPMSKDDSIDLIGTRKANEIDDGTCIYTDGKVTFTIRPHIHKGISYRGWLVNPDEKVIRKGV